MHETEFDNLLAKSSLGSPAALRARANARLSDLAAVYNLLLDMDTPSGWADDRSSRVTYPRSGGNMDSVATPICPPAANAKLVEKPQCFSEANLQPEHDMWLFNPKVTNCNNGNMKKENIVVFCSAHAEPGDHAAADGFDKVREQMKETWILRWRAAERGRPAPRLLILNLCWATKTAVTENPQQEQETRIT